MRVFAEVACLEFLNLVFCMLIFGLNQNVNCPLYIILPLELLPLPVSFPHTFQEICIELKWKCLVVVNELIQEKPIN